MNAIQIVNEVTALVSAGSPEQAEKRLVAVAETEGDLACLETLGQLRPSTLVGILREFDTGKESVVSLLVTPELFARAVVTEEWYGEEKFTLVTPHARLKGMINSIVFRNPDDAVTFLQAICSEEKGCKTLATYLLEKHEEVRHFARFGTFDIGDKEAAVTHAEVSDRDWKEVSYLLKEHCPDDFAEVLALIASMTARADESEQQSSTNEGNQVAEEAEESVL